MRPKAWWPCSSCPRSDDLRTHFSVLRLHVDPGTSIVLRLETTDPDGERTVIRFDDIDTSTNVADDELDLKVPAGTTISRPADDPASPEAGTTQS